MKKYKNQSCLDLGSSIKNIMREKNVTKVIAWKKIKLIPKENRKLLSSLLIEDPMSEIINFNANIRERISFGTISASSVNKPLVTAVCENTKME